MTKEELQARRVVALKGLRDAKEVLCLDDHYIDIIEQENAELIKENEEMKKGLGCETCQIHLEYMRLNDKIRELKQQIEKMKCCENCDFIFRDGNCYYDKECKNKDHWKLRR